MTTRINALGSNRIFDDTPQGRSSARTDAIAHQSSAVSAYEDASSLDPISVSESNPTDINNLPAGHVPTLEMVREYSNEDGPLRNDREMDGVYVIERVEDGQLAWHFPGI